MTNYFQTLLESYLIAEIGVNHNGDVSLAKEMILEAKKVGANAVKFQTFSAELLVSQGTPKVHYQTITTPTEESHYQMIKRLELTASEHEELYNFCVDNNIDFISTPYDIESARFLDDLGVKLFKTASADIVDTQLHEFIAKTGKPTIVATGMATLGEIESVVDIYDQHKNNHLVLLHCVSNYPCSDESLNLKAIETIKNAFGKPIGYSDHSNGSLAAALSIAFGSIVIEKHFTLDKNMPGPDHRASSTPAEFGELVLNVRRAEMMLGSRRKKRQAEEEQMAQVSRKSIAYKRDLCSGHVLHEDDLTVMRPGLGFPPVMLNKLIGKRLIRDIAKKTQVKWGDIEGE